MQCSIKAARRRCDSFILFRMDIPDRVGRCPQRLQSLAGICVSKMLQRGDTTRPCHLPRLCYVTDCGSQEESFYCRHLCPMRHPVTKRRLSWQRIVDFYHATLRLATIAKSLKIDDATARAWQRRMRGVLLQKNGVKRVLMSAAALRKQYKLKSGTLDDFTTAVNYLRKRTKWMRYHDYRRLHLPIGSGVTEAGCKTIFTQRAKLSGMRWKKEGLQVILTFRMLIVSNVWAVTWSESLHRATATRISIPTRA